MPSSFLASATNIVWRLFELHDHDPEPIFNQVGFIKGEIKKPGRRVNFELNNLLWKRATELLGDLSFALRAAECWHPSDLNALGYA